MKCTALTRKGEPCRNNAVAGSDRCSSHRAPAPDPVAVEQLVSMLRAGNYLEIAARAVGLELAELLEYPAIAADLEAARAEAEATNVARVAGAARDSWQAAAWLLERQYPDRWGRPAVRQEGERAPAPVAGPDGLDELAGKRAARRRAARR